MSDTLYLIGNGFDLHHGIKSCYSHFRQYLAEFHTELYEVAMLHMMEEETRWWDAMPASELGDALSQMPKSEADREWRVRNLWKSFEFQLGDVDAGGLFEVGESFLQSYGAEDWSESGHHDCQYEIGKITDQLSGSLQEAFHAWISKVTIPSRDQAADSLLKIDVEAKFMNFNYTNTLERVYGITNGNILHIHGRCNTDIDEIVIGHQGREGSVNDGLDVENADPRVLESNEVIDAYYQSTTKPVATIIELHGEFFRSFSDVTNVKILGHSFGEVDLPYFAEVARNVDSNTTWIASCYAKSDEENLGSVDLGLGFGNPKIAPFSLGDLLLDARQRECLS